MPERCLRRTPRQRIRPGGVEPVLQDIEIASAQIHHTVVVQLLIDAVQFAPAVGLGQRLLHGLGLAQRGGIARQQRLRRERMLRGIEIVQVAKQEAQGIANSTIGLGDALEQIVGNRNLARVVGAGHPQAQNVGTQCLHDLLWRHHIARRLAHLVAVLVDRETMREHGLVRCPAVDGDTGQKRGLEPATVLIGTFQVEIGHGIAGRGTSGGTRTAMHHPAVEPHVQGVGAGLVLFRVNAPIGRLRAEPGFQTVGLHGGGDAAQQGRRIRVQVLRLAIDEDRHGDAPGALA